MPGTAEEKTHMSDTIVASTDDKAIDTAWRWAEQPGLPEGEYFLQVVKDGVGIKSLKIQVPPR